ncbi:MAG: hypothetical protein WD022_09080 [Balneolaceae bacterium]
MNPGFVTSFVIGGLMLLSILAYQMNMASSTQETTLSTINQYNLDNLVEIMSADFERIGFKDNNSNETFEDPILAASDDEKLEFKISDTGATIIWYADPNDPVSSSSNQDDYYLYRIESGTTTSWFPVTYFQLTYKKFNDLTREWDVTADPTEATRVEVEVIIESQEPIRSKKSGQNSYHRTAWKKTFTPNNINKPW